MNCFDLPYLDIEHFTRDPDPAVSGRPRAEWCGSALILLGLLIIIVFSLGTIAAAWVAR